MVNWENTFKEIDAVPGGNEGRLGLGKLTVRNVSVPDWTKCCP